MKNKRIKKSKVDIRKVILSFAVILLLVFGIIIIMGNSKTASFAETKYKKIYVSTGETLWEIARVESANNYYYANNDIRAIIKDIKDINNLNNSLLFPGQELIVPCI